MEPVVRDNNTILTLKPGEQTLSRLTQLIIVVVSGQTEARAQLSSTIIDYHEPFDQGRVVQSPIKLTHG